MQASKIVPDKVYAIRRNGNLVRFKVEAINTRRHRATGSPHDYKSTIEGIVIDSEPREKLTVEPDAVLGPFEEYAELAERKRRETEAHEQAKAQQEAETEALWTLLYEKTGQPRPNDPRGYHQPFRFDYSGISVRGDGVKLLIDALRRIE